MNFFIATYYNRTIKGDVHIFMSFIIGSIIETGCTDVIGSCRRLCLHNPGQISRRALPQFSKLEILESELRRNLVQSRRSICVVRAGNNNHSGHQNSSTFIIGIHYRCSHHKGSGPCTTHHQTKHNEIKNADLSTDYN